MSAEAAAVADGTDDAVEAAGEGGKAAPAAARGSRKWLLLVLALAVPLGAGAGLWFSGLLPAWLGQSRAEAPAAAAVPVMLDVPDIVTNLNTTGRRPVFLKLRAKVETSEADRETVAAQMPRIVDLFQTLLRELRPEELRGSAGTHRLKEELLARANIAIAPARVSDVLFVEMLVQ